VTWGKSPVGWQILFIWGEFKMADYLKMGIVGTGSVALRGLLPHLTHADLADTVRITAVCDPVAGRAEAAAKKFGVPKHFETMEELLEKGDVDAVTLCSPIGVHYEQGMAALEAGKHIHFNKSMSTTVEEANALIDLATRKKLKMVASPGEMLRPHNQEIKRLIHAGAIGDICWAACGAAFGTYHHDESVRGGNDVLGNVNPSWYFRKPGGGPLYDMTVYALHGLTGILGPARAVTAMSSVRFPERQWQGEKVTCDADDNSAILIDFGQGIFAFAYGTAHGAITEHFTGNYYGTKGSIVGGTINGKPLEYPGSTEARKLPNWIDGNQHLLPHVLGDHRFIEEHHVFEDVMQLVDLVRENKPTVSTPEHARHVIDIIESAYKAASTGVTQRLTTTFNWNKVEAAPSLNAR
jgi:predicted dehydrogenase